LKVAFVSSKPITMPRAY